jgi:hypothetical protein
MITVQIGVGGYLAGMALAPRHAGECGGFASDAICGFEDARGWVCVGSLFHFGEHHFKDLLATPLNNSDVVPPVNVLKESEKA